MAAETATVRLLCDPSSFEHHRDHSVRSQTANRSLPHANKGDHLPPIPPPPAKKYDVEATVKHALPKGSGTARATVQREPSDEFDDYDEDFTHHEGQNGNGDTELPDTTLLDSVVLPALASV
jgi:serine/threonine-protein kinase 24/25/MST4